MYPQISSNNCYQCVFCGTELATQQGIRSHLKQVKKCYQLFRESVNKQQTEPFESTTSLQRPNTQLNHSTTPHPDPTFTEPGPLIDETVIETFPRPVAQIYGIAQTRWQSLLESQDRSGGWGGFSSRDEWEFARWIVKSGISQTALDNLLKLNLVSTIISYMKNGALTVFPCYRLNSRKTCHFTISKNSTD